MSKNVIQEKFEKKKNTVTDINQHLETIKKYASECEHVTEMGVRGIVSTWALLAAKPKKIVCYDVSNLNVSEPKKTAEENGIEFIFINADVLTVSIEKTDLLFIDTLHRYLQLKKELETHASNVNKYIIMHDTTTFGTIDEPIYQPSCKLTGINSEKQGLVPALEEFLESEEGKNWTIKEVFTNNNGLTIIERKKCQIASS
jgi:hypothetical protein